MSSSQRKIEFQFAKDLFETISEDFTCHLCQLVPRNGPIFQSGDGRTLCSSCKNSTHDNFHQFFGLEKILKKLPNSCKFKKNNCSAVLASENLEYHEEDCKFRSMLCPFGYCKEIIPAIKLDEHLKSEHGGKEQNFLPQKWEKNKVKISAKIEVNEINFDQDGMWCAGIKSEKNLFLLNAKMNSSRKQMMIWFQIDGSKFEIKNYTCSMSVGAHMFKDCPHSLDEDKNSIFESDEGLLVPFGAIKKNIQGNILVVEAGIEDVKSENIEKLSGVLEVKEIIMHKVAPKKFCREDFSTVLRFAIINSIVPIVPWIPIKQTPRVEAIRFMADQDLIIGGFGLFGSGAEHVGKIQLFDIGIDGGNQEVAGEMLAESDEITFQCEPGRTFPILFKEPVNIKAQRWLVQVPI